MRKNPLPKRRTFLEGAAITSAAVAAFPPGAHSQDRAEIRVGLVGCGGRGTGAASQALKADDGVRLWAMADIDEKRINLSRETLVKAMKSDELVTVPPERQLLGLDAYQQMMERDDIDVVILTTPPGFRPIHFQAAVEAGKHVFMEKPVAVDSTGVRQVIESARLAKEKGLKVGVGFNRRHSPMHEELIQRLHDGEIGDIHTVRLFNCRGGVNKKQLRQPGDSELRYQVNNWYYFTWLSGDFPVEQSVHEYDVVRWIMGERDPVRCQGQGGRQVRTGLDEGMIYDHFDLEYEYDDGTLLRAQHRHIPGCWTWFGEKITGTKGRAETSFKKQASITPNAPAQRPVARQAVSR